MARTLSSVALSSSRRERNQTKIPEPDRAMYGVMGPGYSQYLSTTAADQGQGASAALAAGNAWALRNNYHNEQEDYANMLRRAQDLQSMSQDKELKGSLLELLIENAPELGKEGLLGLFEKGYTSEDPFGVMGARGGEEVTANLVGRSDRRAHNVTEAGRRLTNAQALAAGVSAGIVPSESTYELWQRDPEAPTDEPNPDITYGFIPPALENTIYGTDQGLTAEQQLEKARAGATGEDGTVTVNYGATGEVPTTTYKGTTEQIAAQRANAIRQGINPNTQQPFTAEEREAMADEIAAANRRSPKAGAKGGAAPATPAAVRGNPVSFHEGLDDSTARFWNKNHLGSRKGVRKDPFTGKPKQHKGDDWRGHKRGTPIPSEGDGQVVEVRSTGQSGGYGNQVKIRYDNGTVRSYSHNDRNLVKVGDRVKRGQALGTVGSTGRSTGPHVHVETHKQGVDPENIYRTRLAKAQGVVKVQPAGDHTIVHMADGSKRVYRRGIKVSGSNQRAGP